MIVLGLAGSQLAPKLAASYKTAHGDPSTGSGVNAVEPFERVTVRIFPDGELSVSLPQDLTSTEVLVVLEWSLLGTLTPAQCLLVLLTLVQQLLCLGVTHVTLAVTYLPFARSSYTPSSPLYLLGEQLKLFSSARLITIDLHDEALITQFPVPLINIPTTNLWANGPLAHVKSLAVTDGLPEHVQNGPATSQMANGLPEHNQAVLGLCIISPDAGGAQRAEQLATKLGTSWGAMHKVRLTGTEAQARSSGSAILGEVGVSGPSCPVLGKTVILLDDIVATAGTAVQACKLLRKQGAVRIIGCSTHAVLAGDATARLLHVGFDEIYMTTTLRSVSPDPGIELVAIDAVFAAALLNILAVSYIQKNVIKNTIVGATSPLQPSPPNFVKATADRSS